MRPGRLIRIKEDTTEWGWGVLVRYRRTLDASSAVTIAKTDNNKILPAKEDPDAISEHYVLAILLECSPTSIDSEPSILSLDKLLEGITVSFSASLELSVTEEGGEGGGGLLWDVLSKALSVRPCLKTGRFSR